RLRAEYGPPPPWRERTHRAGSTRGIDLVGGVSRGGSDGTRDLIWFREVDEAIAAADHCFDSRLRRTTIDLATQAGNIDVDHIAARLVVHVPDALADHRACQQLPRVAHHVLEQGELLGRELDRDAAERDAPLQEVHLQVARSQD